MDWSKWYEPATIVAAISAAAAIVAAWIGAKIWRWQKSQSDPVETCTRLPLDGYPGWHVVTVEVRSRSETTWSGDDLEILSPPGARIVRLVDAQTEGSAYDRRLPKQLDWRTCSTKIAIKLSVAGIGARVHDDVLLFVPPSQRSIKLSMRLSLVSSDLVQRRIVKAITRTVPADTRTAKD